MITIGTIVDLQDQIAEWKSNGLSVGYVPTMGALHQGHLSLLQRSQTENDKTICSIFVNPTQFNKSEDLENYPVDLDGDRAKLESVSCDLLFLPISEEIYPEGERRNKHNLGNTTRYMEGRHRPGHFQGVATVVDRFFTICTPDRAYFGEKDFQQLAVIRAMAADVGHDVEIIGCPIVREESGLAMSSRNRRLSANEKEHALLIHQTITLAQARYQKDDPALLLELIEQLFAADPVLELEYVEIADEESLSPIFEFPSDKKARIFIAAQAGNVRLIDNAALN